MSPLFKKKASAPEAAATTEDNASTRAAATKRSGKKRKPAELLSSVVNESAVGAAIDIMKRNEQFALPNGKAWVGLLLAVEDIGGLSQKQKSDATKGSIIELIAADKIQVVATSQMLEEEFLGIIPNPGTLERMEEYNLLTGAKYYWAVFHADESGNSLSADAVQNVAATYGQAVAISRGDTTLADVIPEVWIWGGGMAGEPSLNLVDEVEEAPSMSEFDSIVAGVPVGATVAAGGAGAGDPLAGAFDFGGADVDYASLAEETGADLATGEVSDDDEPLEFDVNHFESLVADTADEVDAFDGSWQDDESVEDEDDAQDTAPADDSYFQYLAENKDRVVDEKEVRDTIARRFLSNDLDLVVDLAEFERVFATEADAIQLSISEDSTDWLGGQIAQLSRQANAELEKLHRDNTDDLRQLYVETMALHVEKTMSAVSTEAEGSQYAALMDGAKRDFETARSSSPQEIAATRQEIRERFEAAAQARADQAAAHARTVYEDKHRPKLERDLAEAGLEVDRRLEEQYAHDRQTVLEMRRKDANVRMDVGTNRIFEHLREVQATQREGERALLERWNERLLEFIDENRKNDLARAAILADDLARTNQIESLKSEHAAELREAKREHAEREEQLRREATRIREEAIAELTGRRAEWAASLESERERTRGNSELVTQLQGQVENLGKKYQEQYQARISTLEAENKAATLEAERTHVMQKRNTLMLVILSVVLTLGGVLAGIITGWAMGYNLGAESAPADIAATASLLL